MGSDLGLEDQKLLALSEYQTSALFDEQERIALRYADAITYSNQDVDDQLFADVQAHFNDDEIVELTTYITWRTAPVSSIEPFASRRKNSGNAMEKLSEVEGVHVVGDDFLAK